MESRSVVDPKRFKRRQPSVQPVTTSSPFHAKTSSLELPEATNIGLLPQRTFEPTPETKTSDMDTTDDMSYFHSKKDTVL